MALDIPRGFVLVESPYGVPSVAGPPSAWTGVHLWQQAATYWIDALQRWVLLIDTLRQRGNVFEEHRKQGEPPVLDFQYRMVLDGRSLRRPVNYALVEILPKSGETIDPAKCPVIVFDPRAGHGPGIGGMKEDSQVGVSLPAGHPTDFVMSYPQPQPGQTMSDVAMAQARFVEEVRKRLLKEQSYTVQLDEDRALRALPVLLSTAEMRREAMDIARAIAIGDGVVDAKQQVVLARLAKALDLPEVAAAQTAVGAAQPVTA